MSRIGKLPVALPTGVTCELNGSRVKITGPKGTLEAGMPPEIGLAADARSVTVTRPSDKIEHRALHGLTRALIQNMVTGVSVGYRRTLMIEGTGYRASIQGKNLNLVIGYSHPIVVEPPEGITLAVEGAQTIHVSGIDKHLVGRVTADIRKIRPVEPYKGKGIRLEGEHVVRKERKTGGK